MCPYGWQALTYRKHSTKFNFCFYFKRFPSKACRITTPTCLPHCMRTRLPQHEGAGHYPSGGVKQGDIISPIQFNAGLELAFRKWKQRLTTEGWLLDGDGGRLTNTRCADDVMLYAKFLVEFTRMLDLLTKELAKVGLHLNVKKTKLLTNDARWPHLDTPFC